MRSKPNLLFFIGDIKSGAIKHGMKIDLSFLGVSNKPMIKSINFVDHIAEGSAEVALEVEIDTTAEKAYLLDHGVLSIPIIIET